ncbi:alpha/beta fold hydrolase [Zhihengliuella halotolerans]|uniref:Pimeloyl-ACP methyl ester carboxylesterase n=1 Tax=Zhihengliuella halotolerans TaxID=370736 RepID=A0A4Q8A9C9_9MICC|nr:alpha/beta hydrolase [Zhihengliuella halotolerans]RZU60534.1 pimeloyl-ACP methyl ester carboxylesterase [Zhihengliuella halotolerans]
MSEKSDRVEGEHADYPEVHASRRPRPDGERTQTLVFLHNGMTGNWSWHRQVEAFGDYRVLTPHLPGYGTRRDEDWNGFDSAADDVAAFIADRVEAGRVHLVGLGLGGLVGLHVLSRHPELIDSAFLSGMPTVAPAAPARTGAAARLRIWGGEWFAKMQAGAFGVLEAAENDDVATATARAVAQDLATVALPDGLDEFEGPVLLAAGAKEPPHIRKGLDSLDGRFEHAQVRIAPGMHHAWNLEEPLLFNAAVRRWAERHEAHPRLDDPA